MAIIISVLRGLNVGANNRIKMDGLRGVYEKLGLTDVQSYVQSGNIVYRTGKRNPEALAPLIEKTILAEFGIKTLVVQRTVEEMREIVRRNPFAAREGMDPARLGVTFLRDEPASVVCEQIRQIPVAPEEMVLSGREMYVYYPNGMGVSKFPAAAIEKLLKTAATVRNWNSVTKLLELGEAAAIRR